MELLKTLNVPQSTLERLQMVGGLDEIEWQDLLQMSWRDFQLVRHGMKNLNSSAIERLAEYFDVTPQDLMAGKVNFQAIQIAEDQKRGWEIPAQYSIAQHGRARTTMTSFEYITRFYGPRLRYETLKHLNMSEATLINEFAPVSMKFITDALDYWYQRQFRDSDFFAMGSYSCQGNRNTIFGKLLSSMETPSQVLELMWGECLQFLEQNCRYEFLRLDNDGAKIEVTSNPDVALEMGVRHLGSAHVCSLKAGMMASAPGYIGEPMSQVRETLCVHHGDSSCTFEVNYRKKTTH